MSYLLIHRTGHPDRLKFRGDRFATVSAALKEVSNRTASGDTGDFLIEAGFSRIVMDDADIAAYCAAG